MNQGRFARSAPAFFFFLLAALPLAELAACNGEVRFDEGRGLDAGAVDEGGLDGAGSEGGADAGGPAVCASDTDCPLPSLHCDPLAGTCFACAVDVHCTTAARPRCDVALHRCVECGATSDCPKGQACEPLTRRCLFACGEDSGADDTCPATAPVCLETRSFCMACRLDVDCTVPGPARLCDPANGTCTECVKDSDCPLAKPRCDRTSGVCAACLAATDCSGTTPTCDPATDTCVGP